MRKVWTPQTTLEPPIPPKGYKYRWLRREVKKLYKKIKYKPVRLKDLKDGFLYPTVNIGRWGKCVGVADLLLIKIKKKHNEKNKKKQRIRA
jgi:hypothetical protein